jgi:2-C-methyl-D-erythritol 4-phosphate cytidylyltransferase
LQEAFKQPYSASFTDDASVMEAAGHVIQLVEGNRENIKITTPEDLRWAEVVLKLG